MFPENLLRALAWVDESAWPSETGGTRVQAPVVSTMRKRAFAAIIFS